MPRRRSEGSGGLIFHVINRGAKRAQLFAEAADYRAFENLERNPLRAGLAHEVTEWQWTSAWRRAHACDEFLGTWPLPIPQNWTKLLRYDQPEADLVAVRMALQANRPYGDAGWTRETALRLGLESPVPRGRPRKMAKTGSGVIFE